MDLLQQLLNSSPTSSWIMQGLKGCRNQNTKVTRHHETRASGLDIYSLTKVLPSVVFLFLHSADSNSQQRKWQRRQQQAVQAHPPRRPDEAHHALPESRVSHEGNPQLVSFADIHHPLNNHSPILAIHKSSTSHLMISTSHPLLYSHVFVETWSFTISKSFLFNDWHNSWHHWPLFLFHQGGLWLKRFHMRFASCPLRRCRLQPGLFRKWGRGKRQLGTRSVLGDEHSRRLGQMGTSQIHSNTSGFGDHQ